MGVASDNELLARALNNPGRLCVDPILTSGSFPYGGRSLGLVTAVDLEWDAIYFENRDPASGAINEIGRRRVEVPRIAFLLYGPGWDEEITASAFTKTTSYASLSKQTPRESRLEGTVSPLTVQAMRPILFAPEDQSGLAVYFRRPLIRLSLRQSTALAARRKSGLPLVIDPTPDTSYATTPYWQICRLENVSL